jgi:hypothetical protein
VAGKITVSNGGELASVWISGPAMAVSSGADCGKDDSGDVKLMMMTAVKVNFWL